MKRTRGQNYLFFALGSLVLCALAQNRAEAQALPHQTTWVGNSFGLGNNPSGSGGKWVQQDVQGISVTGDGTVWSICGWDEGGHEASAYKNGTLIGYCGDLHGWGRFGSDSIAASGTYVFLAMSQNGCDGGDFPNLNQNGRYGYPPCGTNWYCVRRYSRSSFQPSSFSGGYGWDGSFLIVNTVTNTSPAAAVAGLAVDNSRLYVSDPFNSKIRVFNATTMNLVTEWSVTRPGKLALDNAGLLWVLQTASKGNPATVLCYSTNGVPQSQSITFAAGVQPTALAFNPAKSQLLIADAGPDLNIKIYTTNNLAGSPSPIAATFGTLGGYLSTQTAPQGTVGPLRFNLLTGAGADSAGNIYVAQDGSVSGGGAVIEGYSPASQRNWALYGLEFVNCADFDPASPEDIYSTEDHYTFNYWLAPAGTQWGYQANSVNPFKFPQDSRLHIDPTSVFARRIGGRLFLFMTGQYGGWLSIHRFDPAANGETAIPCGLLSQSHTTGNNNDTTWPPNQPYSGEWFWLDSNTNGTFEANEYRRKSVNPTADWNGGWALWVDSAGNIWQGGRSGSAFVVRELKCSGINSGGIPIYGYTNTVTYSTPPGITWSDLTRLIYFPESDTMYLAGFTTTLSNLTTWWGLAGRGVYRYDNWTTTRTLHVGYPIELPNDPTAENSIKSLAITGDYLFAVQTHQATIHVFDVNSGLKVGTMTPGPEVNGTSGWVDEAYGISAMRRPSGEYVVIVEEDLHAKNLVYRWCPDGSCAELRADDVDGNGHFTGMLRGVPGAIYSIEATADWTNWLPIATVMNTTGTQPFKDQRAIGSSYQFYRAIAK